MKTTHCRVGHKLDGNRTADGRCAKCRRRYARAYMKAYRKRGAK